jgi:hypothetical protein
MSSLVSIITHEQQLEIYPIFSYGSNSISQLKNRVHNNELISFPAKLHNYSRIFCGDSIAWKGSYSSITKCDNIITYGSITYLSLKEKLFLDPYEAGYTLTKIEVEICDNDKWIKCDAFAYMANDSTYTTIPSEEYLTSIHVNIRTQFPNDVIDIDIRKRNSNGECETIYIWKHPGNTNI